MNDLIKFLTSEEIIVVYIVIAVACILCLIIYLLDKSYYKRKQKQNTKELNKLVESIASELNIDESTEEYFKEPVMDEINNDKSLAKEEPVVSIQEEVQPVEAEIEQLNQIEEEKESTVNLENLISEISQKEEELVQYEEPVMEPLEYTDIEPNQTEAQAELEKLTKILEEAEEESKNIDLTEFEEEQEQNAIISIEELMAKNKVLYENNELEKIDDEGNEPISIQDLEIRIKSQKEELPQVTVIEESVVVDTKTTPKKFHNSPVISPVYGVEKTIISNDLELENTANYDKLDEEIKKTNEFLITLRELQKKLDQ